jgi:hypothetical protein
MVNLVHFLFDGVVLLGHIKFLSSIVLIPVAIEKKGWQLLLHEWRAIQAHKRLDISSLLKHVKLQRGVLLQVQ